MTGRPKFNSIEVYGRHQMNNNTEFVDLGTNDANVIGLKLVGKANADTIIKLVERLENIKASGIRLGCI